MDFTGEEFDEACFELDNPNISDYEFFVESSGVQIYRKYQEVNSVQENRKRFLWKVSPVMPVSSVIIHAL